MEIVPAEVFCAPLSPSAIVRISQSTVTANPTSWQVAGGAILRSYGDNNIDGNNDGDPAPITIGTK